MEYEIFQPPKAYFDKRNFSKNDIDEVENWFFDVRDQRLTHIIKFIEGDQKLNNNSLDLSEESLKLLEEFIKQNVSLRQRTEDEIEYSKSLIKDEFKSIVEISNIGLDLRTQSICFDCGLYFAAVLKKKYPDKLEWSFNGNLRHIDGVNPTLKGFKNGLMMSFGFVLETFAGKAIRKEQIDLIKLLIVWENLIDK